MVKIALDAMGGDRAPHEIIRGAYLAVKENPIEIILVGQERRIRNTLERLGVKKTHPQIKIHNATEIVAMSESPALSFKRKKDSSIRIGLDLLKEKKVDAFVSAGNTGAVMTTATLVLGRISGVERPAIATLLPSMRGHVVMLDMGSNVDSKPSNLMQFAIMGHYFSQLIEGEKNPRVALLNIGEEPDKGDQLTQSAFSLLSEAPLNFVGNIEGKDILFDKADVVVCDGFVGNSLLKFGEGSVEFFMKTFKEECKKSLLALIGFLFLTPAIKRLKKKTDYEEFGGAPLLGVNGVTIISHGKSSAKAIKNALHNAYEAVNTQMIEKIAGAITKK